MPPTFFVSYRRDDASAEAGRIAQAVRESFGRNQVFLDTSGIEAGERWPDELQKALRDANVLITVIGPDWLRLGDEYGTRRIDEPNDWVRREVEEFLQAKKKIVPVYVRGSKPFPADKVPDTITGFASIQGLELRRDYWDHDIKLLLSLLKSLQGSGASSSPSAAINIYPKPPPEVPDPLSQDRIETALNGSLRQWVWVASKPQELSGIPREELYRAYQFKSFRDAISFMSEVAPGCDMAIHHPRWENVFRTVFVYLSTWDIKHKVSDRDVQLAKYFDRAYRDFVSRQDVVER
ncbi:4a-hydroxytetrahydrobiopterin dehydratase [Geodermatophilus sp. URMC 62]|uniref:4a-hydroxytetrahydrobiopterin dehydratase n=1 Tax=Geodermatophilus sp. URMC 62 TaxID=3423414 RepID=UPI00406D1886